MTGAAHEDPAAVRKFGVVTPDNVAVRLFDTQPEADKFLAAMRVKPLTVRREQRQAGESS